MTLQEAQELAIKMCSEVPGLQVELERHGPDDYYIAMKVPWPVAVRSEKDWQERKKLVVPEEREEPD